MRTIRTIYLYDSHRKSLTDWALFRMALFFFLLMPEILCAQDMFGKRYFTSDISGSTKDVAYIEKSVESFDNRFYLARSLAEDEIENKQVAGFTYILDSIYEVSNLGYKMEYMQWYFSYDRYYRSDSSWRYFFDDNYELQDILEIRTYYPDGKLKRFLRKQPVYDQWYNPWWEEPDTTIIDFQVEEYYYDENKNLIRKNIMDREFYGGNTISTFYFYDPEGKLIRDSTYYDTDDYTLSVMSYDENEQLQYEIFYSYNPDYTSYSLLKYTCEDTDTSRLTKIYQKYFGAIPDPPVDPDSITIWNGIRYFFETFDELGRRASITYSWWSSSLDCEWTEYRAEYSYNEFDDILQSTYYRWEGTLDSGWWVENSHVVNTYNEDGDLLIYDHTFYDERINQWQVYNYKEYYYTPVSSALPVNELISGDFTMYPNPAADVLFLSNILDADYRYRIFNLNGILIDEGEPENGSIPVACLKEGIYLLQIITSDHIYGTRFIKN